MARYPWSVLGIPKTSDERIIKTAYSQKLKSFRPEDDPAGFQILVEARTAAIKIARRTASPEKGGKVASGLHLKAVVPQLDLVPSASKQTKPTDFMANAIPRFSAGDPEAGNSNELKIIDGVVKAIAGFLGSADIGKSHQGIEKAIEFLKGASIAQKSYAELPLLQAVRSCSSLENPAFLQNISDDETSQIDDAKRLAIVQLDCVYEWSQNYHLLNQFIGTDAMALTDKLIQLRNGETPAFAAVEKLSPLQSTIGLLVLSTIVIKILISLLNYFGM